MKIQKKIKNIMKYSTFAELVLNSNRLFANDETKGQGGLCGCFVEQKKDEEPNKKKNILHQQPQDQQDKKDQQDPNKNPKDNKDNKDPENNKNLKDNKNKQQGEDNEVIDENLEMNQDGVINDDNNEKVLKNSSNNNKNPFLKGRVDDLNCNNMTNSAINEDEDFKFNNGKNCDSNGGETEENKYRLLVNLGFNFYTYENGIKDKIKEIKNLIGKYNTVETTSEKGKILNDIKDLRNSVDASVEEMDKEKNNLVSKFEECKDEFSTKEESKFFNNMYNGIFKKAKDIYTQLSSIDSFIKNPEEGFKDSEENNEDDNEDYNENCDDFNNCAV